MATRETEPDIPSIINKFRDAIIWAESSAQAMMLFATNNIIDKDRYNQRALCFSAHRQ
jgi:hypothetical protein